MLDALYRLYACSNHILNTEFSIKQRTNEERLTKPIQNMLSSKNLEFERDRMIIGKYDHSMKVDYSVKYNNKDKLIQMMTTSNDEDYARIVANKITVNWLSIPEEYTKEYRLTVYDPSKNYAGDDSIKLLKEQSSVIPIENNNTDLLYSQLVA